MFSHPIIVADGAPEHSAERWTTHECGRFQVGEVRRENRDFNARAGLSTTK